MNVIHLDARHSVEALCNCAAGRDSRASAVANPIRRNLHQALTAGCDGPGFARLHAWRHIRDDSGDGRRCARHAQLISTEPCHGRPAWMREDRYDFVAKAEHAIPNSELKSAIMAILVARFQLKSHEETRDVPGFAIRAPKAPEALTAATVDEKPSTTMKDGDCFLRLRECPR